MSTDIQLNGQSLATTGTAGTTAPAAGTVETWSVAALAAGIPSLSNNQSYTLIDAAATGPNPEVIRITALTAGGTSITVTRGADGTTPVAHATGATFNFTFVSSSWNYGISAVPSYAPERLANQYDNTRGIYNYKASNTRRLDQGLSIAKAGGHTFHAVIGDSVSAGATSGIGVATYDRLHAWPLMLRDYLGIQGIPANGTGYVRINDANQLLDPRFTNVVGSWSPQVMYSICPAGGSLTFNPDRGGTFFDLLYYDNGSATITVSIDGAASGANFATLTTAASGTTWRKLRMPNVTIRPTSKILVSCTAGASGVGLAAMRVWTPNAGLVMDNYAQSGAKAQGTGSAAWADLTGGPLAIYKDASGRARTVVGSTTAGSPTLTLTSGTATALDVGEPIDQFPDTSGVQFPPNTYVTAFVNSTTLTMNNNALATLTGKTIGLGRDPHCVHIALGGNDMMGFGSAGIPAMTAAITAIRNQFPNSDCILHLENEPSPTLASAATELAFQQAMYQLADTLDVPLYDWRDRAGNYTTAFNNGIMQDYQAHMVPGMYADLGSQLAAEMGGGIANPQFHALPVYDGDLVNKRYVDNLSRKVGAAPVSVTTTVEKVVAQIFIPANTFRAGSVIKYSMAMSPALATITTTRLRIGTAGTTADAAVQAMSATGTSVAGSRYAEGIAGVQAAGAAATFIGVGTETVAAATASGTSAAASGTFDTTKNNWVSVTVTNTTSTTTTVFGAELEVVI